MEISGKALNHVAKLVEEFVENRERFDQMVANGVDLTSIGIKANIDQRQHIIVMIGIEILKDQGLI
jgi:hypothetical protein